MQISYESSLMIQDSYMFDNYIKIIFAYRFTYKEEQNNIIILQTIEASKLKLWSTQSK